MEIFFFVVTLALIPALIARSKGRSGFLWWIYGCLLLIVAIPHALLASDLNRQPCPHCSEKIMKTANICPRCHREVVNAGLLKQLTNADTLVEKTQRDAQAKLAVGDTLSLTAEREEGMPARVRLDSKHGPVGYLRQSDVYDALALLGRQAYDAQVSQSTPGKLKVTIRFFKRPADAPIEREAAASA